MTEITTTAPETKADLVAEKPCFRPRTILLLGGTSEIGLELVAQYLARNENADTPLRVIAGIRDESATKNAAVARLEAAGALVEVVAFDACQPETHPQILAEVFAAHRIDLVIVAFGFLPLQGSHDELIRTINVNTLGAISVGKVISEHLPAQSVQDGSRGRVIVLSSMAAEVVRPGLHVYGAAKAGTDAYYLTLRQILQPKQITVTIARPGQVKTKMTAGMKRLPFRISPRRAAREIIEAVDQGKAIVRTPAIFTLLAGLYRKLPDKVRSLTAKGLGI